MSTTRAAVLAVSIVIDSGLAGIVTLRLRVDSMLSPFFVTPNAGRQALPEAEAKNERRL
jgi:hypothetical protein